MSELPPLSIGQPIWPGLAKLLEEAGELQQVMKPTSCGRVLAGQGTDTYDPLCIRPAGHPEVCQP